MNTRQRVHQTLAECPADSQRGPRGWHQCVWRSLRTSSKPPFRSP